MAAVWSARVPNMHRNHPCGNYCKTKDSINGCFNGYWLGINLISRGCQISKTSGREMGTSQVQGKKFSEHLLKSSFKQLRGTDYQRDNQRRQENNIGVWKFILEWADWKSVLIWFHLCMTQFCCWVLPDFMATHKPKWRSATCLIGPPLLTNESLQWFGRDFVGGYSNSFPICPADPRGLAIITVLALTSQIKKDFFLQYKLFWQELFGQYLCSPKMFWEYKQKYHLTPFSLSHPCVNGLSLSFNIFYWIMMSNCDIIWCAC